MAEARTVYGMTKSGKPISRLPEAVRESILDILSTPKGTRPMRPSYGLSFLEIIDRPMNEALDLYILIAEAVGEWEPRFRLKEVSAEADGGQIKFSLFGVLRDTNEPLTVTGTAGGG